mmetsp:Transcript_91883/g.201403  ORF Transcript_91883/g.201403 Transcript_91883/m.201403 type:complete len:116 (+) Transcript_91883:116-463(+)
MGRHCCCGVAIALPGTSADSWSHLGMFGDRPVPSAALSHRRVDRRVSIAQKKGEVVFGSVRQDIPEFVSEFQQACLWAQVSCSFPSTKSDAGRIGNSIIYGLLQAGDVGDHTTDI